MYGLNDHERVLIKVSPDEKQATMIRSQLCEVSGRERAKNVREKCQGKEKYCEGKRGGERKIERAKSAREK